MAEERYRNWAFIVYPDSAPGNWKDILDQNHVPWYCSPLHDKDVNPTGEPKKPHWHVILTYTGKQCFSAVKRTCDAVNATRPENVKDLRSYLRYFSHLDNPEKAQYSQSEIEAHSGADLDVLLKPTAAQRYACIADMRAYCREHRIYEFSELMDIAAELHPDDWFPLLCDSSAYVMQLYVTSLRNKARTPVDRDAGEVE